MPVTIKDIVSPAALEGALKGVDGSKHAGPDGMTKAQFARELPERLEELGRSIGSGEYTPGAVMRIMIPKADGRERPIAIANVIDKVVHRAVASKLASVIEPAFLDWSCCRAGLGAKYAADLAYTALAREPSEILCIDIQNCYGNLRLVDIEHLLADYPVTDEVIALVMKLLDPPVLDTEGHVVPREREGLGIEQGLPLSPLMANLVLHHAFDLFVEELADSRKTLQGAVRYLDDALVFTQWDGEPADVMALVRGRLDDWGLPGHAKKCRIVPFGPSHMAGVARGARADESFEFVGYRFSHGRLSSGGWAPFRAALHDTDDPAAALSGESEHAP